VNKWDVNPEMTEAIEDDARQVGVPLAGRLPYDTLFTDVMIRGKTVVEHQPNSAADIVRRVWRAASGQGQ